jgi:hypothetical protein
MAKINENNVGVENMAKNEIMAIEASIGEKLMKIINGGENGVIWQPAWWRSIMAAIGVRHHGASGCGRHGGENENQQ